MNQEITITLTISVRDEEISITAVQAAAGEEEGLEIASADEPRDTAVVDLPPPPQLEAFESLQSLDLPPVPEVDQAVESAVLESRMIPELPPVPEAPES